VPSGPVKIVSIGGGNGLSTLLRGLKRYARQADQAPEITAVVTVTDDGGSSGRLRREFSVPPPGDIRSCMVALSEDETLLTKLFQYRFLNGRGLKGHSFGNLFLTAMTHLTGDFGQAVKASSEVLAVLAASTPPPPPTSPSKPRFRMEPRSSAKPASAAAAPESSASPSAPAVLNPSPKL